MGHRERLLAAARRCLVELGYSRTTARDLVAASGTNLASIGYHFGSKEALLAEALDEVFVEYTEKVLALAGAVGGGAADPAEAVRTAWIAMTDLQGEYRPVLVAFVEALAQAERHPALRARLAAGYEQMRRTIVAGIAVVAPELDSGTARSVASFFMAVSDGYMLQWLLDPAATPSGAELLHGAQVTLAP
jgi:AcrR family transcriptional regulator